MAEDVTKQEILAANERFYRALAEADLTAMSDVWHHSAITECIHPGWDRLRGWPAIRDSWAVIFANQGSVQVRAGDVLVRRRGDVAWVTCYENLAVRDQGTVQMSQMLAINIFERIDDRWRMVIHHAAPAPPGTIRPRSWRTSLN